MEIKCKITGLDSANVTIAKTTQCTTVNNENKPEQKINTDSKVDINNKAAGIIPKENISFTSAKISDPPPGKITLAQGIFAGGLLTAGFTFAARSLGPKAMIATAAGLTVATAVAISGNNNNKLAMSTGFAVGAGTISGALGSAISTSGIKGAIIGAAIGGALAFSGMYFLSD